MLKMCKTLTFVDGGSVDVQYSNWKGGHPQLRADRNCVLVKENNEWESKDCVQSGKYVCQSL